MENCRDSLILLSTLGRKVMVLHNSMNGQQMFKFSAGCSFHGFLTLEFMKVESIIFTIKMRSNWTEATL